MPPLPDNARQATLYPTALENNPCSRSISDDDLCAWCSHLLYRPGERSLCSLSLPGGTGRHAVMRMAMRSPARHSGLTSILNPINKQGKPA